MKYFTLGDKKLSRICLGTMNFGQLGEDKAKEILEYAYSLGINFFDTANCYSGSLSEIYLGKIINKFSRDKIFITSKVYFNDGKLSYGGIIKSVTDSLKRLNTSYLDLLLLHRFDKDTSPCETFKALRELKDAGKVKHFGISSMTKKQAEIYFKEAKDNQLSLEVLQHNYSLMEREENKDLMPLIDKYHLLCTPYSPLAGGLLCFYEETDNINKEVRKRVKKLSEKYNVNMSVIALAYLLQQNYVKAVIIGASEKSHIDDAALALSLTLSEEELNYLDEAYISHQHEINT